MDAIIFDIDGTLADVGHRRHLVTQGRKDWGRFFDEMVNDPPHANVCLLAELLAQASSMDEEVALFIFSGRPDNYREQTETWLPRQVPTYWAHAEALLMRAAGDFRPDTEVKREMLHAIQGQGYNVRFVVDDRPSVIQMWKDEGLTVLEHDGGEWEDTRTWNTGELHLLVGPSGAGKSTFLRERWAFDEHPHWPSSCIISSDALREEITGDWRTQTANDQVFKTMHAVVRARIKGGLNCVVDATNLRAADRRALRDCCDSDTKIVYHVIDRPLAEKHRDAGWRADVEIGGQLLIDRHHQSFQSGIKHILRGDSDPRVTVVDVRRK